MQEFEFSPVENGTYCVVHYLGDEPQVTIPDTYQGAPVSVLYDNLFAVHPEIESIHIPDAVTDLGEFLFDGCDKLRHLTLPSHLQSLWGHTFCRSGLIEVTLPDSLVSIPPFAFKDCKHLRYVVCGSGLRSIGGWAFSGCEKLEKVVHGPDVQVSPNAYETQGYNIPLDSGRTGGAKKGA